MIAEGYEGHFQELGGYTVAFESHQADADVAPLFEGLPDDRCQCPHWGYVVSGSITFRYADREETFVGGDAYYATPGHTPVLHAGSEIVEFSPTDALDETVAVVGANLERMTAVAG
jgi:hypothetical protein